MVAPVAPRSRRAVEANAVLRTLAVVGRSAVLKERPAVETNVVMCAVETNAVQKIKCVVMENVASLIIVVHKLVAYKPAVQ